nr:EamA family transporter [Bailinhaonella thermotolerans]
MSAQAVGVAAAYENAPRRPLRPGALLRAASDAIPPSGLVLMAILSVQLGASFAKTLFATLSPSGVTLVRIATGALIMLVVVRPRLRGHSWRDLGVMALFGLSLAGMNLSFYEAMSRLPLGVAVAIEFLGPLALAVAASRRRLDILWVLLAGAGVLLLIGPWNQDLGGLSWAGIGFALLAALGWAAYILLSAATGKRFSGTSGLALAMGVAAIAAAPAGVATAGEALLDPHTLLIGCAVGLLSSVIPYSIELEALRRMPPRVFGILMSLEPAVAALLGLVVLQEFLDPHQWAAILCVVIASAGATKSAASP